MKKENLRRIIVAIVVVAVLIIGFIFLRVKEFEEPHTEYKCDVKNLSLSTKIEISKENETFVKVSGNILRFVTDPLTMYDLSENKIAYADDSYHLVAQDSHVIYVNNQINIEMVGLVDVFGETYEIYNANQEKIAYVTFNMFNTRGEMYDSEDNLIADYNSNLLFNDFNVRISKECKLDEKAILMIFCSYYSDQYADNNN